MQRAKAAGLARRVRSGGCDLQWQLTNPDLIGYFDLDDRNDIDRIGIEDPSRYRTAAGIGVGSTVTELRRAYGSELWTVPVDPREWETQQQWAYTTAKGSIIFDLNWTDRVKPSQSKTDAKHPRNLYTGDSFTGDEVAVSYMAVVRPPVAGSGLRMRLSVKQDIEFLANFSDEDPC